MNLMIDILSTYYKSTLAVIIHKLNFSGNVDKNIFFLFWYVELVPKICTNISMTPCIYHIINVLKINYVRNKLDPEEVAHIVIFSGLLALAKRPIFTKFGMNIMP
jgi:hypothetical protein